MEYLDIIDIETDTVIGNASHDDVYKNKSPHRIVHLIIHRSNGNIVLQKRSAKKYHFPNTWTTSSCGHVTSGETYEQSAIRETEEEIGITPDISQVKKLCYENEVGIQKMLAIFRADYDGEFTLNFEVSEVREFSMQEILELPEDMLHPELKFLIDEGVL